MADAKLTALTAASALAAADLFYVSQSAASRKATGTQLLTLVGTAYVPLAGGTMTGPLISSSSLSGSNFYVNPNGNIGFNTPATGFLFWDDSGDVRLYRDAAATLALRNGAAAQTLRIYGTADGSPGSNYQRMVLSANGTTGVTIAAEGLGTPGANQNITLTPGGTGTVLHPLGTYGTPGIGFVGYPNTGIWTTDGTSMGFSFGSAVGVSMSTTRLGLAVGVLLGWNQGTAGQYADDIALARNAAGVLEVNSGTAGTWRDLKLRNLIQTAYHEVAEMTAPAAPATNSVRIYAEDNGAGKTRLMALFASGVAQQIAIEP